MQHFKTHFAIFEAIILCLLLPPLLFPSGNRSALLLLLPLLWLGRWLVTRRFIPPTPFDSAMLLLLMMVGVSLVAVFDIELSFPKIAGVVLGITLFYGAVNLIRVQRRGGWYVLTFVVAVGLGMGFIGLIGLRWPAPFAFLNWLQTAVPPSLSSIPGTIDGSINPNELAGVLDWLVPLLLVLLLGGWRQWSSWVRLGLLLASGSLSFLLLATGSRGGILACGVALLVVLALRFWWGRWLLLTAVVAAIILFFQLNLDTLLFAGGEATDQLALAGRLEIWSRALYGIADFPFTGMSMNGFRRVVHILYPLFLVPPDTDLGHAHNHLLQAALDLGLLGLIAYLAIWLLALLLLWQSWRQATEPRTRLLALGLIGSFTAGWFFGILDAIALGARPGFIWWLLLALVVGVHDAVREKRPFFPNTTNINTDFLPTDPPTTTAPSAASNAPAHPPNAHP